MSYSQSPGRLAYLKRCREEVESKLLQTLPNTNWTPLEPLQLVYSSKLLCRCKCGTEKEVRVAEILGGKSSKCLPCAAKEKAAAVPAEIRRAMAVKASQAAWIVNKERSAQDPLKMKFGVDIVEYVSDIGTGAKQRCTNPNNAAYCNYGDRGIQFCFPDVRSFTEWVLNNLGSKPTAKHTLDRIDNNAHYEPGNLRWATRDEQARNKRAYKRTEQGERIRALQELRPDLTYETIRTWIKQGLTDDEITQRVKYARPSV